MFFNPLARLVFSLMFFLILIVLIDDLISIHMRRITERWRIKTKGNMMRKATINLKYIAIKLANEMYGHLEDLKEVLSEMTQDNSLDDYTKISLLECYMALPEPELLDELIARLGCIDDDEEMD